MFDLAREFPSEDDVYILVTLGHELVAMGQMSYQRHLQAYELKTLVSMFPHAGKLVFGRALAIARHHHKRLVIFSLASAVGFYNALPVCKRVTNDTFEA